MKAGLPLIYKRTVKVSTTACKTFPSPSLDFPGCYQKTSFCFSLSALELIKTAIEKAGFTDKVVIGMDVAASEFFIEGKYDLDFKSPPSAARNISGEELASIYQGFINNYPGVYFSRRNGSNTRQKYFSLAALTVRIESYYREHDVGNSYSSWKF